MTQRSQSAAPREVRVFSYIVECRIPRVAQEGYDSIKCSPVATSNEEAIRIAVEQLQPHSPTGALQTIVIACDELNPLDARKWLEWHRLTDRPQLVASPAALDQEAAV